MRRIALRPDGRPQEAAARVSLFPFLAVLICTMGALILLLVVIARQARLQAAQAAAAEAARGDEDLKREREMAQWRIEQLKTSLKKTQAQLADARLSLGHIEDHARRLRDQLARLQAAYDDLNRLGSSGAGQRSKLEAELKQMEAEVAEAQRRLAAARRAAAERPRSYAVVPYRGPHQTDRRPIYVECRAEAVILQPEGIVFRVDDFAGPLGPGNPLAAALRAAREYLLAQERFDPEQSGEPYPLLLVRPDGIAAYYAARAAMKSWASEFGYELIGEDWKIEFQSPDPQLAGVMHRAVATARVRQEQLAAAAPSHYGRPRGTRYRASPSRGGVVPDYGSSGADDAGFQPRRPSGPLAGSYGSADKGGAVEGSDSGHQQGERTGVDRSPTQRGSLGRPGGAALRPGEWRPSGPPGSEAPDGQRPATGQPGRHLESLAKHRGRDWGLPDAAGGSIPISRPIRIRCDHDRLVIVPEEGLSGGKSIRLGPRTEESIDEFVSAVWEHMQSWGIAGSGMYWRPILDFHVAPDGEGRYADLQALLEGSGLRVERKQ